MYLMKKLLLYNKYMKFEEKLSLCSAAGLALIGRALGGRKEVLGLEFDCETLKVPNFTKVIELL